MTIEPYPDALIDRRRRSKVINFKREAHVVPIYHAIIVELERKRHAMGISMDEMSELMGTAERAYAKMLYPETSSGRVAQWPTLQKAIDVLFCEGFDLILKRNADEPLTSQGTRRKIINSAAHFHRRTEREVMAERGRKGGQARAEKMTREQRSESARKAVTARWKSSEI